MKGIIEPKKIEVEVGVEMQDFAIGDYLNAINAITCYFQAERMVTEDSLVDALRLYANHVEEA